MNDLPKLGITMGDAAGIGPELIINSLLREDVLSVCRPFIIGSRRVIESRVEALGIPRIPLTTMAIEAAAGVTAKAKMRAFRASIPIIDLDNVDVGSLRVGTVSAEAGRASVEYIVKAVELIKSGQLDGTVSGPVNKEAMNAAGFNYAGQTELFMELTGATGVALMIIAGPVRFLSITSHVALRRACDLVTRDRVVSTLELAHEALIGFGIADPKIGVAGINPHAGEGGLFGDEEIRHIGPAVEEARLNGINAVGPIPADSIFPRAKFGEFDAVVVMYHDQGNIAMKLLGYASIVTVAAGLPIVRTSVGHGTAFDIAGKGIADPTSFIEAIKLAARIAALKSHHK